MINDFSVSFIFGVVWSIPVALAAILLPRSKALGAMNGIALIAILGALGLRIAARIEGDITGYILSTISLQWEVVAAAALLLRLGVRRRID